MYKAAPIRFLPGINPSPDETKQGTAHIVDGNNIRFFRGRVEKIGGHAKESLDSLPDGCVRSLFSFERAGKKWQMIGTHTKLYAKLGSSITNITPLKTTAEATLGTNPLSVTSSDETMTVTYTAHGLAVGDRIKLSGAADTGGVTAATYINIEHIIATVPNANSFTVELGVAAGSTATGGGGSVQIFVEIEDGACDAELATGPGIGTPGLGLPGSLQTDPTLFTQPRIWWMDAYGDNLVCGPGNGGKCYQWLGDTDTAPAVISNAPVADWGWIEDAKLVTLYGNTVANSDTGDLTDWTASSASSAYSDDKEDATKLIGRVYANGENLVFAEENKVFRLRWIGGNSKWLWEKVSDTIGITSPHGGISIGNIVYLLGKDNLYYYNGGIIAPLPGNTLYKWMYENINLTQRYKCFVWHNQRYNEAHFHFPAEGSTEPDRTVIFSLTEGHFSKREDLERSAADRGGQVYEYPILASPDNGTYQHEVGTDDDTAALNAWFQVGFRSGSNGTYLTEIYGMEPDLEQTGNMTVELYGKDREHGTTETLLESFTLTTTTGELETEQETRWYSWLMRSNVLGGFFRTGNMLEWTQRGSEF